MPLHEVIEGLDLSILRALYAGSWNSPWAAVVSWVTFLGSGWMLVGLIPAFFSRTWSGTALALLVTLGATSGTVASVKSVAGRVRPCHAIAWARALPLSLPTDPSFPSGHAAGSFAFAFFVLAHNARLGAGLGLLATAIALTRVSLGVHYPSDVLVGSLLGALLGWLGAQWALRGARASTAVRRLPHADSESIRQ